MGCTTWKRFALAVVALATGLITPALKAQQPPQPISNGYTSVLPSYTVIPPTVPVYVSAPYGVYPAPVVAAPVIVQEPAFLHTSVVPYDPVWPYAYMGLPGTYYRERVRMRPREVEYQLKTYGPYGGRRLDYEVEFRRRGIEVEQRLR